MEKKEDAKDGHNLMTKNRYVLFHYKMYKCTHVQSYWLAIEHEYREIY